MYTSKHGSCVQYGVEHCRSGIRPLHGMPLPVMHHRCSSSRCAPAQAVRPRNYELADRTKEYWDDEEDIQAAVERLGINKVQQGQDSSPLLSQVNQMYLKKTFAEGFLGSLELRYFEGM